MGPTLSVFEADTGSLSRTLAITGALAVLALGGWIWITFLRKGKRSAYGSLGSLLLFALLLTSGGAAFFSGWTIRKMGPVAVYEKGLTVGKDTLSYGEYFNYYFHRDQQKSMVNPGIITEENLFLILEGPGKKTIALSEKNYDIRNLEALLDQHLKAGEREAPLQEE